MFGAEFFSHHGSFGLILALRTIVAPRVVVVGLDVDVRVLAGGAARCIAVVVVVIAYIVVVVVFVVGPSVRRVYESEVTLSFVFVSFVQPPGLMYGQTVCRVWISECTRVHFSCVRASERVRPSVRPSVTEGGKALSFWNENGPSLEEESRVKPIRRVTLVSFRAIQFIYSFRRTQQAATRPKLKKKNGSDGWIAVIRGAGIRRHGTALSNVV